MAESVKGLDREPEYMAAQARRLDRGAPAAHPIADWESLLPARVSADGTSRRILLSALVLFAERGYHAVPVREIAQGAGVRASSMYEYRAGKEDLLRELLVIGHEEHRHRLRAALAVAGDDPAERVRELVRAHVAFHATYPLLASLCNRDLGSLSAAGLEAVLTVRREAEGLIMQTIREGVEAGVFTAGDPWLAGAAIGGMGIRVAEWFGPAAGYELEDVADAYADFALKLLGHQV